MVNSKLAVLVFAAVWLGGVAVLGGLSLARGNRKLFPSTVLWLFVLGWLVAIPVTYLALWMTY